MPDAFFRLTLATTSDVLLTTSVGSSYYIVAMSPGCGPSATDFVCRGRPSSSSELLPRLAPGTYYVAVHTASASGTIAVTADVRAPSPVPSNDRCPGLALDVSATVSRTDTLVGFEDDLVGGSCAGVGRPDAFYTFSLSAARRVILSASAPSTAPIYLTLRTGCVGSTVVACSTGGGSAAINQILAAGTYTIQVEQDASTTSAFNLTLF